VISYTLQDEEKSPHELIAELEKIVEDDITDVPMQNAYSAHVKKLLQFFEEGQTVAFSNQIRSLLKKVVKDQVQGSIDAPLASEIQEIAYKLLGVVDPDPAQ
jgi:hypothetical protein